MTTALISLGVNLFTRLCKKLGMSATIVSIGLSLIAGSMYYVLTNYYAIEWKQIVLFATTVYAESQIFYNLYKKFIAKE